ncbi:hypothetical protein [Tissierella sp. P1]|nr:hypothetical protein [Tissierella sp. P1]
MRKDNNYELIVNLIGSIIYKAVKEDNKNKETCNENILEKQMDNYIVN